MKSKKSSNVIKIALVNSNWWSLVSEEVKTQMELIIDNIEVIGDLFQEAFVSHFKLAHAQRILEGITTEPAQPGVLFGRKMTEECYQSGINPTKACLQLEDWTKPNEADVQACMFLCNLLCQISASPAVVKKPFKLNDGLFGE